MHFRFPRRLIILVIVVVIVFVAFGISGCSQLSSKQSSVNSTFFALVPELSIRYQKLANAIDIAKSVGGERDITRDTTKELSRFSKAKKEKNIPVLLDSSQELEIMIGRLRANASSSPKLATSQELAQAIAAIDAAYPGTENLNKYYSAVKKYEENRRSWRHLFSSTFGGYSSAQRLELSPAPTTTTPEK